MFVEQGATLVLTKPLNKKKLLEALAQIQLLRPTHAPPTQG
jgi:BarA-like signal transduction histidine kinase